jgi:hypothetical protein
MVLTRIFSIGFRLLILKYVCRPVFATRHKNTKLSATIMIMKVACVLVWNPKHPKGASVYNVDYEIDSSPYIASDSFGPQQPFRRSLE